MKILRFNLALAISLAAFAAPLRAGQPSLDPHLEMLRPLLEKTWKGQFKDSKPDKPTVVGVIPGPML